MILSLIQIYLMEVKKIFGNLKYTKLIERDINAIDGLPVKLKYMDAHGAVIIDVIPGLGKNITVLARQLYLCQEFKRVCNIRLGERFTTGSAYSWFAVSVHGTTVFKEEPMVLEF